MNNKEISNFINDVLMESALDNRVEDGIIDLTNESHIDVVYEVLQRKGLKESGVDELLETILTQEGKYPDRQAYNKDGWLVTFPSKEYRDAAIKRGTHAISDPTHGKGGMNLYYKRKGKQKRQTQQASTSVQTQSQPQKLPAVSSGPTTQPVQTPIKQTTGSTQSTSTTDQLPPEGDDETPLSDKDIEQLKAKAAAMYGKKKTTASQPTSSTSPAASQAPEAPKPAEAPAIDVPVVTTPPEQYSSVSKKFADKKGWRAEPYGEYRDAEGNTVAVVGLSGEIVPVKSVDRDEYKIFAEKNMT
jgi:cytoskeletal protein RodZ